MVLQQRIEWFPWYVLPRESMDYLCVVKAYDAEEDCFRVHLTTMYYSTRYGWNYNQIAEEHGEDGRSTVIENDGHYLLFWSPVTVPEEIDEVLKGGGEA